MQFSIAAKFAVLFAAMLVNVNAAPTTPNRSVLNSVNDCGDSSFINQSSGGSPLISDCQMIQRNIAGGGTWTTNAIVGQRQLVQYGTCAFGVTVRSGTANVGNQDIIDIINTSIQMFSYEGRVGSKGTMPCQGPLGGTTVDWGLY